MLTNAKLQRLWQGGRYRALIRELCAGRPEGQLELDKHVGPTSPTAAAALGLMRLIELNQSMHPLAAGWADRLLWEQNADGSWRVATADGGDADATFIVTALAIRALASPSRGMGLGMVTIGPDRPAGGGGLGGGGRRIGQSPLAWSQAVARGLDFLAKRQTVGGGWGQQAGFTTGVVLLQLGRLAAFTDRVRIGDALSIGPGATGLVGAHVEADGATRLAWRNVQLRCGAALAAKASGSRAGKVAPLLANVA